MTYTIGELITDPKPPVTVRKTDTVLHVAALMRQYDYSQLPVVNDANQPIGIVTSDSILRALDFLGGSLKGLLVSHAMMQTVPKFKLDDYLSSLQNRLLESYAALIVDDDEKLIGIVTNYDTAEYYRRRAKDLMLIEEIESALRDHVQAAFNYNAMAIGVAAQRIIAGQSGLAPAKFQAGLRKYFEAAGQSVSIDKAALTRALDNETTETSATKEVKDLALNDLISLLFSEGTWERYSATFGNISKAHLRSVLVRVRDIRNVLAHFKRELTPADQHLLNWCADFLALHRPPQPGTIELVPIRENPPSPAPNPAPVASTRAVQAAPINTETGMDESKYSLLYTHLRGLDRKQTSVTLTFGDIENIIQTRLPNSARELRAWWANDSKGHSQSKHWLDADWRVAAVDMDERNVTFARMVERDRAYVEFFSKLGDELREAHGFEPLDPPPEGSNAQRVAAIDDASGTPRAWFAFTFTRGRRFRTLLLINLGRGDWNEAVYGQLQELKDDIAADFGQTGSEKLIWDLLPDARSASVTVYTEGSIQDDDAARAMLLKRAADTMVRLRKAFADRVKTAIDQVSADREGEAQRPEAAGPVSPGEQPPG